MDLPTTSHLQEAEYSPPCLQEHRLPGRADDERGQTSQPLPHLPNSPISPLPSPHLHNSSPTRSQTDLNRCPTRGRWLPARTTTTTTTTTFAEHKLQEGSSPIQKRWGKRKHPYRRSPRPRRSRSSAKLRSPLPRERCTHTNITVSVQSMAWSQSRYGPPSPQRSAP